MIKFYTILIVALIIMPKSAEAQERREKIKTLKIAYITEQLELSQKEAQLFWPIYNEYEENSEKHRASISQIRRSVDLKDISESEASSVLEKLKTIEENKHRLRQQFIENLGQAISSKKILLLKKAEEDFRRKMIDEFKKRRRQNRGQRP